MCAAAEKALQAVGKPGLTEADELENVTKNPKAPKDALLAAIARLRESQPPARGSALRQLAFLLCRADIDIRPAAYEALQTLGPKNWDEAKLLVPALADADGTADMREFILGVCTDAGPGPSECLNSVLGAVKDQDKKVRIQALPPPPAWRRGTGT